MVLFFINKRYHLNHRSSDVQFWHKNTHEYNQGGPCYTQIYVVVQNNPKGHKVYIGDAESLYNKSTTEKEERITIE